jgi:transposase-like protein
MARRTYTREFKLQALRMLTDQGLSVAEVARRLGVGENCLRNWRAAAREQGEAAFPGQGQLSAEEDELRRLRRAGKRDMEAFCRAEDIPFEICGKVIVAVTDADLPALQRICERGQANGVACALIDRERLAELAPHAAGARAIHVPETGIVNYRRVCECLAEKVRQAGGEVVRRQRLAHDVTVHGLRRKWAV